MTMALRQMTDVSRYGTVTTNPDMRVTGFTEKNQQNGLGYINGGTYLIKHGFFDNMPLPEKFSFEKDCLEQFYTSLNITGFPSQGYFLDIGIPEDYEKAQYDFH